MKHIRGRFLLDTVHARHKSLAKSVGLDLYMENATLLFIFHMHMPIHILSGSKLASSRSFLFTCEETHVTNRTYLLNNLLRCPKRSFDDDHGHHLNILCFSVVRGNNIKLRISLFYGFARMQSIQFHRLP